MARTVRQEAAAVASETEPGEAVSFALENEQFAFYVLSTGEEVRIDHVIHPHEYEPTDLRGWTTVLPPITLLELGLHARSGKLLVVCTPGFYRYDNVRITCDRYGVPVFGSINEAIEALP